MSERQGTGLENRRNRKMSGFESQFTRHYAQIAQSVEQGTENPCVRGSIPRLGTIRIVKNVIYSANQCLC